MKFNSHLALVRSDLCEPDQYREAVASGTLKAVQVVSTQAECGPAMWHRRRVSGQRFVDVLSSAPIDIEGFTVKPRAAFIDELTRHVETTQYFIPISGPILSPVAPSCNNDPDQPDPERLVTVRVLPGEAIEIARGAWHTLPFALSVPVACISIVHRLPDGVYHDVRDLPAHGWIGIVNL